ncbi:hypothetical protein AVEN_60304-1 [Araneus ventricosus]|uniref:Uncharacterized protein n=1 Tax=Araneus ventricosus TaxID=182803 RepID=A0A4Y2V4M6_ARAVE|nr:hypothetical protein AVEN_102282-1 [Araneus ventricosus]GBO19501.1 hypothetical protein AVEN_60304-1 [Araneus ventricosus]
MKFPEQKKQQTRKVTCTGIPHKYKIAPSGGVTSNRLCQRVESVNEVIDRMGWDCGFTLGQVGGLRGSLLGSHDATHHASLMSFFRRQCTGSREKFLFVFYRFVEPYVRMSKDERTVN